MTREQFIRIIQTEQDSLRRFLLALCCGNRDEADDIAQDTLVKAYLSISKYEGTAWLYRIAYNMFIDSNRCHRTIQPLNILEKTDHIKKRVICLQNRKINSIFAHDYYCYYKPKLNEPESNIYHQFRSYR